jgi:hypothetical protein
MKMRLISLKLIYKNWKIKLGKMQNLGDDTTFMLNCDFVCDIVNAEEMKTFPKNIWVFKQPCLEKSAFISEHSAFVKQNV